MKENLKLRLKKVTLRALDEPALNAVVGGQPGGYQIVTDSNCSTCRNCEDHTADPSDYCTNPVTCCPEGGNYCA
ncbi:MAG: hypothetical protein JO340_19645 [Acidobacteriaceae bacterium]|nr:hypothetical protein [Acidobacteriaceae bacterium]